MLIWGSIAVVALAVLGYALWVAFRPSSGESIPIMASSNHVDEGEDPGPYNSDPPTSGLIMPMNLIPVSTMRKMPPTWLITQKAIWCTTSSTGT